MGGQDGAAVGAARRDRGFDTAAYGVQGLLQGGLFQGDAAPVFGRLDLGLTQTNGATDDQTRRGGDAREDQFAILARGGPGLCDRRFNGGRSMGDFSAFAQTGRDQGDDGVQRRLGLRSAGADDQFVAVL
ncbi:hypothetical protein D3C80_984630 [compost metagenome]